MNTTTRLPRIQSVRTLPDFQLVVAFDNGEHRLFDVYPYMDRGVFQALKNLAVFERIATHPSFVEWPGEIDLSADTLYLKGQPILNNAIH
jgi:hypothetical protein